MHTCVGKSPKHHTGLCIAPYSCAVRGHSSAKQHVLGAMYLEQLHILVLLFISGLAQPC